MSDKNSSSAKISTRAAESVINATIGQINITRKELAARSGMSLTTVSKIADSLVKNELMTETTKPFPDKRKGVCCLNWSTRCRIAVFDISTRDFICSTFSLDMTMLNCVKYTYDDMISLEQNFRAFVFKCTSTLSSLRHLDFCAVITNDLDRTRVEIQNPFVIPPMSRDSICEHLSHLFPEDRIVTITYIEALQHSKSMNLLPGAAALGISYILVGKSISSIFISPSTQTVVCRFERLPYYDGTLHRYIVNHRNSLNSSELLLHLCDVSNAAYSPDIICLESDDPYLFQNHRKDIVEHLRLRQKELPEIYIQSAASPLYFRGAAIYIRQQLAVRLLTSSIDREDR